MKVTASQLVFGVRQAGMKRQLAQARHAARYFGAEAVANAVGINSYKEDLALRYGYKNWEELPREIRRDATKHYMAGRRAENTIRKGQP